VGIATVVTTKGYDFITFRLRGAPAAGTEPLNVGWGISAPNAFVGTANKTDVGAFDMGTEANVLGTSSQVTTATANDTYQVVGTITAGGTDAIVEAFLTDIITKPFTTTVTGGTAIGTGPGTLTLNAAYTPANGTFIQCRGEVLTVTAGTGTTTITVTRTANGSASQSIASGDVITTGNTPGTGTFGTTAGSLFVHATFATINLASGDSIQFTFKVQMTP
jgi:hypothetical protein